MKIRTLIGLSLALLTLAACNLPTPTPAGLAATPAPNASPLPPTATLPAVTAPQLSAFRMLSATDGWALTAEQLLRTSDGGATWLDVTPAGVNEVGENASTFFLDSAHAWMILPVSGQTFGTLYTTDTGGHSWTSSAVPFERASLQFFDPQNGIAFTSLGVAAGSEAVALYSTTNGGSGWNLVYTNDPSAPTAAESLPLGGQKSAIGFRHASHGYVGGSVPAANAIYLYETQDSGATWFERTLPWPENRAGAQAAVETIHFVSDQEGYIVTSFIGTFQETFVYRTTDGGETWVAFASNMPRSRLFSILPGPTLYCWSRNNSIYYTLNGTTWDEVTQEIAFGNNLRALQFVDATTGFALNVDANSGHATFYVSHDHGATWDVLIP